jgi:SAM-dependent methyltransferase
MNNKFQWSDNYRNVDLDPLDLLRRISKRLHQRKKLFSTIYNCLPLKNREEPPRILEVASGMGIESSVLSLLGYETTGIDNNPDALAYASRVKKFLTGGTEFMTGDAFSLDFKAESFDGVLSQGFLEHFQDDKVVSLIREQIKVLKPGGYLLIDVPNKYSAYSLYKLRFSLFGGWIFGFERQFSPGQITGFVKAAGPGMKYVDRYGWSFLGYPVKYRLDYAVMAPLLILRTLTTVFGKGHDSVCVVFRKSGE